MFNCSSLCAVPFEPRPIMTIRCLTDQLAGLVRTDADVNRNVNVQKINHVITLLENATALLVTRDSLAKNVRKHFIWNPLLFYGIT